jgi:hypothetical protein
MAKLTRALRNVSVSTKISSEQNQNEISALIFQSHSYY